MGSQCSYVPTRARASYLRAPLWTEQRRGGLRWRPYPQEPTGPAILRPHVGDRLAAYFKSSKSKFRAVNSSAFFNFQFLLASCCAGCCNNQWAGRQSTHKCHMHFGQSIGARTVTDSNMWHSNMTVRFIVHLWDQLIHIHARQT